jgi:hypothetical protein
MSAAQYKRLRSENSSARFCETPRLLISSDRIGDPIANASS